jgi:hypothetical protein
MSVVRTDEEIIRQTKYGEDFSKNHPYSFFGDDNKEQFRIYSHIVEMAVKENKSKHYLEGYISGYSKDSEFSFAESVVFWLFDKESDAPYINDDELLKKRAEN